MSGVVSKTGKLGNMGREPDSILEPVRSLPGTPSLASWAFPGCRTHHFDVKREHGSLEAEEQETNLDSVRAWTHPGLDGKTPGEKKSWARY